MRANLITPLDSSTIHKGAAIEAILTEPIFTLGHRLIFPEGSRLLGSVVTAQHSRYMHRNDQLRFTFQSIEPPASARPDKEGVAVNLRPG